jgi:hypothetical protein
MRLFSGIGQIGIMVYQWNKNIKGDPPLRQKRRRADHQLAGPSASQTGRGAGWPGSYRDQDRCTPGQFQYRRPLRPVLARPELRSGPDCSGLPPSRPGYGPDASVARRVMSRSKPGPSSSLDRTGGSQARSDRTMRRTARSQTRLTGFLKQNAEVSSGNGKISSDTIKIPSPTSEQLGNTLQAILELSLSYSIVRNTKSPRYLSSSTQTQIPPGKR